MNGVITTPFFWRRAVAKVFAFGFLDAIFSKIDFVHILKNSASCFTSMVYYNYVYADFSPWHSSISQ